MASRVEDASPGPSNAVVPATVPSGMTMSAMMPFMMNGRDGGPSNAVVPATSVAAVPSGMTMPPMGEL